MEDNFAGEKIRYLKTLERKTNGKNFMRQFHEKNLWLESGKIEYSDIRVTLFQPCVRPGRII